MVTANSKDNNYIELRGERRKVQEGVKLVNQFIDSLETIQIELPPDELMVNPYDYLLC